MKNGLIGALVAVLAGGLLALAVVYWGWYDVAATKPHAGVTRWAFGTLQHSSVSSRAADLEVTLPTDSASLEHGLVHYDAMCVSCHGAPGVDRGELGRGMTPTPPDLAEEAPEWSDAELFWITKHGIKLAGMPAFGPTHSGEEIRGIVAFVRRLPEMTAGEYADRVRALQEGGSAGAGHTHEGDGHSHDH